MRAIAATTLGTAASEGYLAPAPARRDARMPRFHFNVYDGVNLLDREGTELPNWQAARLEAIQRAGEFLKDEADRVALGEDWRIEVTDHTGLVLFHMSFLVIESPVMRREFGRSG
jgi:hypothetical protein